MASLGAGGLSALTTHPPTLEELFLRHYRDEADAPEVTNSQGSADPGAGTGHRRGLRGRRSA